jgi:putative (di)nucleoside polyphosphate hydrolase
MPRENETVKTSDSVAEAAKPYRRNAAAVVINADGHVLVGWKHETWQLPQGGVDDCESFAEALVRELSEEIGTDRFRVIAESAQEFCYDWPGPVAKRKQRYRGQRQRYYLVRFEGTDDDLDPHVHGEFAAMRWLTPAEVLEHAWEVKLPIYRAVMQEFGLLDSAPPGRTGNPPSGVDGA